MNKLTLAAAAAAVLAAAPVARAEPLTLFFNHERVLRIQDGVVYFPTNGAGTNIEITDVNTPMHSDPALDIVGSSGTIGGQFAFDAAGNVTTVPGNPGFLEFIDGNGYTFRAELSLNRITLDTGNTGSIDPVEGSVFVNLTNFSYAGGTGDMNPYLNKLFTDGSAALTISFTLGRPADSLADLMTGQWAAGFDGTIVSVSAVPVPAAWVMMATGGVLTGAFGWKRRRQAAKAAEPALAC